MKPSRVTLCDCSGVTVKLALSPAPRPWQEGFKEPLRETLEQWKFKLPGKLNMSLCL